MPDFRPTELPEVILIEPTVHRDERGFFFETYHAARYREAGIDATFVQDNQSKSTRGTLRGLHANTRHPQGKLVRVIEGEVFDVAVDIRRGSPRFACWCGVLLSADNCLQVWVPPGFAHGFYVTTDTAQVEYKVTEFYDPGGDIYIAWNDPEIAIDWPLDGEPILSRRDRAAPPLAEVAGLPQFAAG